MRRLKHDDRERGAVAPMTAMLMVALLGMTAFAVDVAMMYSEHAQLQNGADSSAIGIAQACAQNAASADCAAPTSAATSLAGSNALDGVSNAPVATVNLGTGTVDVTTQSRNTSGDNHFTLVFARALGVETANIQASAQAKFGGFSAADTIPLTFSQCEADPTFFKGLQFFPVHGTKLSDEPDYACPHQSSSGFELPGGFGWLKHPGITCSIHIDVDDPWIESGDGTNFDKACEATFAAWESKLKAGKAVEALIPIFETYCPVKKGSGTDPCNSAPKGKFFKIEAFAQISVYGWQLKAGGGTNYTTSEAATLKSSLKLGTEDTGLFGTFIKKVSLTEAATLGGPTTYGALGVQLTE
ncbi:TadE/TadG family type IV pilus assembly protein [Paenarthrobacter nitroguajacolicus]|uniref:TadE/TadG family type IV pilus assembly protein n=1 Tax=Paenarthrobacter nitroguajacolicus TaxID=211146 RepID=UPI00342C6488